MDLQEKSEGFKEFFLLAFTRELVKNYIKDDILKLKIEEAAAQEAKKELVKEKAKEIIKEIRHPIKRSPIRQLNTMNQRFRPSNLKPLAPPRRLVIPRQNLPPRLQYIKPIPTGQKIDLKKLNPYIRDPMVQTICGYATANDWGECDICP